MAAPLPWGAAMRSRSYVGGRAAFIRLLKGLGLIALARQMRSALQALENKVLATVYPDGRFIHQNNAEIFVDFKDPNFRWYLHDNLFLRQEHEAFQKLLELKSPGVIIDIGAHWGIFPAMLDADPRFSGCIKRVICIEPDPKNIPKLQKTVSRVKNFPVTIVEAAIGDRDAHIPVYRDGGCCLHTYASDDNSTSENIVVVLTLESILSNLDIGHNEITHIKIDIDGYEPAFFLGNKKILKEVSPLVLSEYWTKGLLRNKEYSIHDYWSFLSDEYCVYRCNYPEGDYTHLAFDDFKKLNENTISGIANLLLLPKRLNLILQV